MGRHDQSDVRLVSFCSRDDARVTDFWRELTKIGVPHLHSVRRRSTTDGKVATWMRALIRALINFFQRTLICTKSDND